jgi:hypothetical protein
MARYGFETGKKPEQIVQQAKTFFGKGGIGLDITEEEKCCLRFVGGGGHVHIVLDETTEPMTVTLETREWDYQVKQFMRRVT